MNTEIEYHALNYLNRIKKQSPLVHNITNFVVMNSSANILLALGASPVMAHCKDEVEEMVSISKSLVLNIGTLDKDWVESMIKAAKVANRLKIPVVLDIVGAGATQFRTKTVHQIMNQCKLSILRGNASEIMAITSAKAQTLGVDSSIEINNKIVNLSKEIALRNNFIVAISGEKDIITDGTSTTRISNGHPIMKQVTGMGCGLSAFTGAFCAIEKDSYRASIAAFALYGICGDLAAKQCSNKPGNFFQNFLDNIYTINSRNISKLVKADSE